MQGAKDSNLIGDGNKHNNLMMEDAKDTNLIGEGTKLNNLNDGGRQRY